MGKKLKDWINHSRTPTYAYMWIIFKSNNFLGIISCCFFKNKDLNIYRITKHSFNSKTSLPGIINGDTHEERFILSPSISRTHLRDQLIWEERKQEKREWNEMKWNEKRRNNCENLEILYIKKLINNFWYVFIITNLLPHLVQSIMLILNVFSFNSRV